VYQWERMRTPRRSTPGRGGRHHAAALRLETVDRVMRGLCGDRQHARQGRVLPGDRGFRIAERDLAHPSRERSEVGPGVQMPLKFYGR
jgi:hypothetical protein